MEHHQPPNKKGKTIFSFFEKKKKENNEQSNVESSIPDFQTPFMSPLKLVEFNFVRYFSLCMNLNIYLNYAIKFPFHYMVIFSIFLFYFMYITISPPSEDFWVRPYLLIYLSIHLSI